MEPTQPTPDIRHYSVVTGNKTDCATKPSLLFSYHLMTPTRQTSVCNLNPNMAGSHNQRTSHVGQTSPTYCRISTLSLNKQSPTSTKPSDQRCCPNLFPPLNVILHPLLLLACLPPEAPHHPLKILLLPSPHHQTPHPFPKRLTPSPLAQLGGSQSDPAQTPLMPVAPKHERVKANPPQGAPAATATAKHGSHTTLLPAHGVDTPCMPHVHSLRCPRPYAYSVTPSLSTSLISNQYEACPLQ